MRFDAQKFVVVSLVTFGMLATFFVVLFPDADIEYRLRWLGIALVFGVVSGLLFSVGARKD